MKGGKGGHGRQNSAKPVKPTKELRRDGAHRGSPKRDWGAIERDVPVELPQKQTKPPSKKGR